MQRIFEKLRNNKVFRIMAKPVLCMMLAAGLLFSSLSMTVQAEDVLDTTWYTLSSAASGWLSDTLAKGNDVSGIPGGSVGGVLGYCDEANTSGVIIDLIQSTVSSSSATYSYDALSNMGNVEFVNYGNYGRALRSIGLDGTGTSSPNAIRAVAGNLLLGLYNVSTFVNHIFSFVVDFLRKINPYRLFTFKGGNMVNFTGGGIEKMTMSDGQTMAGYMNNLLAFLRDNFAWLIIIPASVTFLIWALFLSNRNKGYEIKKFIWRIAIIFFSVPIMGGIYTSTLDWIDDEIDPKNGTPSAKIVASMLVDFESWAQSGLAVDGGIVIHNINTSDMGATQDANVSSIRNICLTINNKACPSLPTAISGNADNAGSWNSTISGNTDNADINSVDVSSFIRSLCVRYASGDKYTPSDYRGWWTSTHATPFEGQPIEQTVKDTDTLLDWTSNNASAYLSSDPAGLWSGADKPWTGMSPMSVYNYLSTEFSDSGIIIYSNEKASSGFIRDFHYSVNLVGGNGLVSVLIFINGATMLGVLIVLALGYACGIMTHSVMRTFKVITSIPMATLGSLRYGAKLIGNTIMMLVEVVVSLFMYCLAVSLMYGSMDLVDVFFSNVAGSNIGGKLGQAGIMCIEYTVSIVMYIWLAIMLLKYRKKAVKAVDEMVCGFVNRLVPGANADDMMDKDKASKLGNGLKTMAGTAAGAVAAGAINNALAGGGTKNAQAGDSASGEATDGGGGDGGSGGSGGNGGDVAVSNSSVNNASDDDMVYKEDEDAGGDGFDNDDAADDNGKDLAEADSLDDAGHGIEEDGDAEGGNADGDEDGDGVPEGDESEEADGADGDGSNPSEGDAAGGSAGGAAQAGAAGQGAGQSQANSQANVQKAQAALSKSEQQKAALEKALGMSADKATAASGGSGGRQGSAKEAESGYTKALAQADASKGGPAATVKATTGATKAAEAKKGAPLTPAEAAAAQKAAKAVMSGAANTAGRGVAPVTSGQMKGISDAATQAAKAANGGKLSAAEAGIARDVAAATAKGAYAAATPAATTTNAAVSGAQAALGGKPLSATDKAMAEQAANEVRAAAQHATSPAGMAQSAALAAARAANGGRELTNSQYNAVKNTASQAAESVQSSAIAAAQAAKGGPLTNAEMASVKNGCATEAAQQAAVNAVEKCMETPLTEAQRGALMDAARDHANNIMADNSQVRQAEKAAAAAASAVGKANGAPRMSKQAYASMMNGVRSNTQQAVANAQPANIAARSAVQAANNIRRMNNQAPLSANQVTQVANTAMQSAGVADSYGGTAMEQYQEYASSTMAGQAMTNNAQEMARQMSADQYSGMNYAQQAEAMRSQTQSNYQQIEAMKSQLAAKGYSQEQISAMARNENAAARGEGPAAPKAGESGPTRVDLKSAAVQGAVAGAMMGSGIDGLNYAGGQMAGNMFSSMGKSVMHNAGIRNSGKRTLGSAETDDVI